MPRKKKADTPPPKSPSPDMEPTSASLVAASLSAEKEVVTTKSFSSTTCTRKGKYSQSREEFQVLPKFKIPRLSWDDMALDLEENSNFDSDLETHVEKFAPTYSALKRKDKQYVIANIKNMLNSVSPFVILVGKVVSSRNC
jgi:hypothetical protein